MFDVVVCLVIMYYGEQRSYKNNARRLLGSRSVCKKKKKNLMGAHSGPVFPLRSVRLYKNFNIQNPIIYYILNIIALVN